MNINNAKLEYNKNEKNTQHRRTMENTSQSGVSSQEDQSVPSKGTIASRLTYDDMIWYDMMQSIDFGSSDYSCGEKEINFTTGSAEEFEFFWVL